jgi:hypothetical protein
MRSEHGRSELFHQSLFKPRIGCNPIRSKSDGDVCRHIQRRTESARDPVIQTAEIDGFDCGSYSNCNQKDILYFVLEFYEAKIMRALVYKIVGIGADSIAWVHDGIYVSKDITKDTVFDLFIEAAHNMLRLNAAAVKLGWTAAGQRHTQWKNEVLTRLRSTAAARAPTRHQVRHRAPQTLGPCLPWKYKCVEIAPDDKQARNEDTFLRRKNLAL